MTGVEREGDKLVKYDAVVAVVGRGRCDVIGVNVTNHCKRLVNSVTVEVSMDDGKLKTQTNGKS